MLRSMVENIALPTKIWKRYDDFKESEVQLAAQTSNLTLKYLWFILDITTTKG